MSQEGIDENENALEGKAAPGEDITANLKQLQSYNSATAKKMTMIISKYKDYGLVVIVALPSMMQLLKLQLMKKFC